MINFDIIEKIREAQRLAVIENIKANAIIINKNFVKTPNLFVVANGVASVLPPMICGLEMYFTDNELPENYSFAIADIGQTERDRLVSTAKQETAKEILDMFDDRNYISESDLKEAIAERYGVEVE